MTDGRFRLGGGLALVAGCCGHSLGLGIVGLVSATPLSERVLFFSFDFVVCFKHLKGRVDGGRGPYYKK